MDISSLRERQSTEPMTVAQLNSYIKNLFDRDKLLLTVSIRGEISNFKRHTTGHFYFTLKDSESQIKAVMFRSATQKLKFLPENGMKVILRGSVSVYAKDGSYQFYALNIEPDGIGALYLAYEQLKAKLEAEGLFDRFTKLPLPKYPSKIGVITSPTGAAVRDIINVIRRRFPPAKIYLYPSLVQGSGAEENLIEAVDFFDRSKLCDIVIIGRGGGSIEDLWAFNSEALARRIFSAQVPIISAVGHETDFTICDFVSDLRAPTPSAAAELSVPDIRELFITVDGYQTRLTSALISHVKLKKEKLKSIEQSKVLKNPLLYYENLKEQVEDLKESVINAYGRKLEVTKNKLAVIAEKTNALSPLNVLARGYSVVSINDKVIKSADELKINDEIQIRLSDATVFASVEKIYTEEKNDEKEYKV